jgi:hypothetical protein
MCMRRLVRGFIAGLAVVPLAVFAAPLPRPPASAEDNGVGLRLRWAGAAGPSSARLTKVRS